jgi:hypothetical protein
LGALAINILNDEPVYRAIFFVRILVAINVVLTGPFLHAQVPVMPEGEWQPNPTFFCGGKQ